MLAESLEFAEKQFAPFAERLRRAVEELRAIERNLDELGAPWTPGRV